MCDSGAAAKEKKANVLDLSNKNDDANTNKAVVVYNLPDKYFPASGWLKVTDRVFTGNRTCQGGIQNACTGRAEFFNSAGTVWCARCVSVDMYS